MNKTLRNFWIDIILFLLLGMDIALVILTPRKPVDIHPGLGWHIHILINTLLTFGCLVHIALHWRWFQAVLTSKAKGRMKLIMQSIIIVMMLAANLSGHAVLASGVASRLHSLTGTFALLGLFVHAVRHTRWMAMTARRLAGDRRPLSQIHSSE